MIHFRKINKVFRMCMLRRIWKYGIFAPSSVNRYLFIAIVDQEGVSILEFEFSNAFSTLSSGL